MRPDYLNLQNGIRKSLFFCLLLLGASGAGAENADISLESMVEQRSVNSEPGEDDRVDVDGAETDGDTDDGVSHQEGTVIDVEAADNSGFENDGIEDNKTENSNIENGDTETNTEESAEEQPYHIYRQEHPENPCDRGLDTYDYKKQWYDSSQLYVNTKFCEPALWFDNYFSNDRIFEEGVAGTYIRLRNDFIYDEEDYFEFKVRLKASVELPGTESRMRLTFEGEDDEDLRDIAPGNGDGATNSLSLQLDLTKTARSKFNVSISLTPRLRFRYRYTYPITNAITMRLTQDAQREKSVHSAKTRIDYEHLLWKNFLFRASSVGEFSEEYDGVDWLQAFTLYQKISKKTSIAYETSVNGITEPETLTLNYRAGIRYRKNFHREWLFYEIVPDYTWPVTLSDNRLLVLQDRRSKWRILFRLEIHFGNAIKRRYQDYNQVR